MGAVQLQISVSDIEAALASFDVIRVQRSVDGELGTYNDLTAPTPAGAVLDAPTAGPYTVVGKTLSVLEDSQGQVDTVFTGSDPLTAAQVAAQINAATGTTFAYDASGTLRLASSITGTASKAEIADSDAAADFGWVEGDRDIGEDAHVSLVEGQSVYTYTDNDGAAGYYYRVQYYNSSSGLTSAFSDPFLGSLATLLSPSSLSLGKVDLVNLSGVAVPDQDITFYSMQEALSIEGFQVGLIRAPITVRTDNAGHAEVKLARGAKVRVVFEGTALIREFTVPDVDEFDVLDEMSSAPDPYDVKTIQFPSAIRRTL
jgi:hypothetical protein